MNLARFSCPGTVYRTILIRSLEVENEEDAEDNQNDQDQQEQEGNEGHDTSPLICIGRFWRRIGSG